MSHRDERAPVDRARLDAELAELLDALTARHGISRDEAAERVRDALRAVKRDFRGIAA